MQMDTNQSRLEELRSYRILDTPREMTFDQIAFLASTVCEVPIALVSFIDDERQWFKSAIGIEVTEVPRALSICVQSEGSTELREIEDMSRDTNCKDNPIIKKHNLRFYAGVPLISPAGHFLGAICVFDDKPRRLTSIQKKTLKVLAGQVMDEIEMRRRYLENLQDFQSMMENQQTIELKQQQLIHSIKMDALAEMAAGVNFQINDPLSLIKGCIQTIKHLLEDADLNRNYLISELNVINTNLERMTEFMKCLKLYINEGGDWRKPLDMNQLIEDLIFMLGERCARTGVKVNFHKVEEVFVVGNPGQITQAMHCLLANALDATAAIKGKEVLVQLRKEGAYSVLRVSDHGPGVSEDIKSFIFQPFFSTKNEGKKGDVCLSLARAYVEQHMGELRLEKTRDPTIFTIRLPLPAFS